MTKLRDDAAGSQRSRACDPMPDVLMTRDDVLAAFGMAPRAFRNWSLRGTLDLDADDGRAAGRWRRYTYRDALKLGVAAALADMGLARSLLAGAVDRIVAMIEDPAEASDWVAVLPDGRAMPLDGNAVQTSEAVGQCVFMVLRLATITHHLADAVARRSEQHAASTAEHQVDVRAKAETRR